MYIMVMVVKKIRCILEMVSHKGIPCIIKVKLPVYVRHVLSKLKCGILVMMVMVSTLLLVDNFRFFDGFDSQNKHYKSRFKHFRF